MIDNCEIQLYMIENVFKEICLDLAILLILDEFSLMRLIFYLLQIIFPLLFTNMTDKVDIEATVNGGGPTGQSGVVRWGIAWGLRSFVDRSLIEKMRVGKKQSIQEITCKYLNA